MRYSRILKSILVMCAIPALAGFASDIHINVKPGLWETTAREIGSGRSETSRKCIVRQDIAKAFNPYQNPDCKSETTVNTSTVLEMHGHCSANGSSTDFSMHLEAPSPETVKTTVHMNTAVGGQSMKMDMTSTSKWLGSSCGNVK